MFSKSSPRDGTNSPRDVKNSPRDVKNSPRDAKKNSPRDAKNSPRDSKIFPFNRKNSSAELNSKPSSPGASSPHLPVVDTQLVSPRVLNAFYQTSPSDLRTSVELFNESDNELSTEITFSGYAVTSEQVMSPDYLAVKEGDLLTITLTNPAKPGVFTKVTHNNKQGMITTDTLGDDTNIANIYLQVMDVVIQHPPLLDELLDNEYLEYPEHKKDLFLLLSARKLLWKNLEIFCEAEFQKLSSGKELNTLFRDRSPAISIISLILQSSERVIAFRDKFIGHLRQFIQDNFDVNELNSQDILNILDQCFHYFNSIKPAEFPPELIILLKTIKNLAIKYTPADEHSAGKIKASKSMLLDEHSSALGAIFFLRFINPGLITYDRKMIIVAKALQLISNQTDPNNEDLLLHPISTELSHLQKPIGFILNKFAEMDNTLSTDQSPTVRPAACFYWLLMTKFYNREHDHYTLKPLIKRLGYIEKPPFTEKDKIPKIDEIKQIANFIDASRPLCELSPLDGMSCAASRPY